MQSDTKLGPAPHEQASGFYLVAIVISCSGDLANDWPHLVARVYFLENES